MTTKVRLCTHCCKPIVFECIKNKFYDHFHDSIYDNFHNDVWFCSYFLGNTPFFLQDPYDQTCIGPNGFTVCDERSLWILTKRAGKKTYSLVSLLNPSPSGMCLERKSWFFGLFGGDKVGMGLCSKTGSKTWEFNFIDNTHVKLSTKGQCLVRGKNKYKNSVTVQNCNKGEFLPLVYHPTSVHEAGFYLKAADGECFDGSKFRNCEGTCVCFFLIYCLICFCHYCYNYYYCSDYKYFY